MLRFSRARSRDPFETLEDSFDALAVFINTRVLVPASSPSAEAVVATLAAGQEVAGYEVERLVSALEDTEVYFARAREGTAVALKIARPDARESVALGLAAEARMLEHLGGQGSPALVRAREPPGPRVPRPGMALRRPGLRGGPARPRRRAPAARPARALRQGAVGVRPPPRARGRAR